MSAPPPNPDSRELPYGWVQQYNWDYRQWFYVNTRENPPRSSWEHPLGPTNFAPPGPPPDRAYSRSPYGDRPYGGGQGYDRGYQPGYGPGYNGPPGGYGGQAYSGNRGPYYGGQPQPETVYVEEDRNRRQRKGPGMGTALLAGGAGLVGGALLMDAVEDHNEREREEGFDQGYQNGFDNGYGNGYDNGFDNGFDGGGW